MIRHVERITHCSLGELQQPMFSGLEKSYDAEDGTDSRCGTKNLISMSAKVCLTWTELNVNTSRFVKGGRIDESVNQ